MRVVIFELDTKLPTDTSAVCIFVCLFFWGGAFLFGNLEKIIVFHIFILLNLKWFLPLLNRGRIHKLHRQNDLFISISLPPFNLLSCPRILYLSCLPISFSSFSLFFYFLSFWSFFVFFRLCWLCWLSFPLS